MPGDEAADDDADADEYPDLPPEQVRRLACLDRALDRAETLNRPVSADQIVAEARVFDVFVAGP